LQFVGHLKNGQPPVAIGSSPDGVTSGGQIYFPYGVISTTGRWANSCG
jgi:hypothetical protein